MNTKNLNALVISRYITYFAIFLGSLAVMGGSVEEKVYFSFLFMIVLATSSLRSIKLQHWKAIFILSIFVEIPIIAIMSICFDSLAMAYYYIVIVDIYLFLTIRVALSMNVLIVIISAVGSADGSNKLGDIREIFVRFIANGVVSGFFAAAAYLIKKKTEMKDEMQVLYDNLRYSKNELEEANKKLMEYSERIEDIAVLNERNRLAGEIHDNIGHNLTALIMEIDICGKLIDKDVPKAKEELAKASKLARHTLSEVRHSVKAIMSSNSHELTGINAINELVRDFEKSTEIVVKLKVSELRYRLSPTVEVTLYRTIQEALTNCAKHGQADKVAIEINFNEGKVKLNIKDNGKGCSDVEKGVGLKTMEERVASLGGSISFSEKDGFIISMVIPVEVRV